MQQNIIFLTTNLSRNIIRSYARRVVSKKENANPGIQKRINVLEEREETELENVDVEEFESDFMNLGEVHRQHEKERKYYREKEKFWIVKQKYFKENNVNFLTWNDKEQIRFLHQSNPTEWSIEKLSEGFPALPETIMKIIKSNWHIKNESKRRNHDQAVERNWNLLKSGKLSDVLPQNLISHLSKFSSRKQEFNLKGNIVTDNIIEKNAKCQNNEFSSIINNYEKIKQRDGVITKSNNVNEHFETTNTIESKLKSYGNKNVTLKIAKGDHIHEDQPKNTQHTEVNLLENLFNKNKTDKLPQKFISSENSAVGFGSDKNKLNILTYPNKIQIPKEKYKKGYMYKVNDCYYDDDGEFLYRVPGMY